MTQFHEGQEVEVAEIRGDPRPFRVWRKAKIVERRISREYSSGTFYCIQFLEGSRAVFDAAHIRQRDYPALDVELLHQAEDTP